MELRKQGCFPKSVLFPPTLTKAHFPSPLPPHSSCTLSSPSKDKHRLPSTLNMGLYTQPKRAVNRCGAGGAPWRQRQGGPARLAHTHPCRERPEASTAQGSDGLGSKWCEVFFGVLWKDFWLFTTDNVVSCNLKTRLKYCKYWKFQVGSGILGMYQEMDTVQRGFLRAHCRQSQGRPGALTDLLLARAPGCCRPGTRATGQQATRHPAVGLPSRRSPPGAEAWPSAQRGPAEASGPLLLFFYVVFTEIK